MLCCSGQKYALFSCVSRLRDVTWCDWKPVHSSHIMHLSLNQQFQGISHFTLQKQEKQETVGTCSDSSIPSPAISRSFGTPYHCPHHDRLLHDPALVRDLWRLPIHSTLLLEAWRLGVPPLKVTNSKSRQAPNDARAYSRPLGEPAVPRLPRKMQAWRAPKNGCVADKVTLDGLKLLALKSWN